MPFFTRKERSPYAERIRSGASPKA